MTSDRTRVTTTIRHDSPVPRKHRKKSSTVLIVLVVLFAIVFLMARTSQRGGVSHARPASVVH